MCNKLKIKKFNKRTSTESGGKRALGIADLESPSKMESFEL